MQWGCELAVVFEAYDFPLRNINHCISSKQMQNNVDEVQLLAVKQPFSFYFQGICLLLIKKINMQHTCEASGGISLQNNSSVNSHQNNKKK